MQKVLLPLARFAALAIGILICMGLITLQQGYVYWRAGIAFIASGTVTLGYSAFANQNKDYHF
jgi:membrane protein implicated in regulation of membrane protease activity